MVLVFCSRLCLRNVWSYGEAEPGGKSFPQREKVASGVPRKPGVG